MLKASFLLNEASPAPPEAEIADPVAEDGLENLVYSIYIDPPKRDKSKSKKAAAPPRPANVSHGYKRQLAGDDAEASIRLLKIPPGKHGDKLKCELVYAMLADHPRYQALSYCWGDEQPTVEIECDGEPFLITPNLASALRAFRRTDGETVIWADAICINQSDVAEKNHQVPLMRRIYEECEGVLIWLGNDTPDGSCASAISILQKLAGLVGTHGHDVDLVRLARQRRFKDHGLPDIGSREWKVVRDMVERPWFGRTWIVQEVVVSPAATVYCDAAKISWQDFQDGFLLFAARLLPHRVDALPSLLAHAQAVQLMSTTHVVAKYPKSLELLTVLSNHMVAQATNPRDKVYGLLGLYEMAVGKMPAIVPDYRDDVAKVFTHAALEIINTSDNLDILSVPKGAASSENMPSLPSWAPDWSDSTLGTPLTFKSQTGEYAFNYNAAQTHANPRKAVVEGERLLVVSGHRVGQITKVGAPADPYRGGKSASTRVRAISTMTRVLTTSWNWEETVGFRSGRTYATGCPIAEAYARTLFLDDFSKGFTAADVQRSWESRKVFLGSWSMIRHVGPRTIAALEWWENRLPFTMAVRLKGKKPGEKFQMDDMFRDQFTHMLSRRIFVTDNEYIGVAPLSAEVGDCVFLVKGSRVPIVLRPGREGRWRLVGDCYMHGVMYGEQFKAEECADIVIE